MLTISILLLTTVVAQFGTTSPQPFTPQTPNGQTTQPFTTIGQTPQTFGTPTGSQQSCVNVQASCSIALNQCLFGLPPPPAPSTPSGTTSVNTKAPPPPATGTTTCNCFLSQVSCVAVAGCDTTSVQSAASLACTGTTGFTATSTFATTTAPGPCPGGNPFDFCLAQFVACVPSYNAPFSTLTPPLTNPYPSPSTFPPTFPPGTTGPFAPTGLNTPMPSPFTTKSNPTTLGTPTWPTPLSTFLTFPATKSVPNNNNNNPCLCFQSFSECVNLPSCPIDQQVPLLYQCQYGGCGNCAPFTPNPGVAPTPYPTPPTATVTTRPACPPIPVAAPCGPQNCASPQLMTTYDANGCSWGCFGCPTETAMTTTRPTTPLTTLPTACATANQQCATAFAQCLSTVPTTTTATTTWTPVLDPSWPPASFGLSGVTLTPFQDPLPPTLATRSASTTTTDPTCACWNSLIACQSAAACPYSLLAATQASCNIAASTCSCTAAATATTTPTARSVLTIPRGSSASALMVCTSTLVISMISSLIMMN